MSYTYVDRSGQRVEDHVATAFDHMNMDFQHDTGYSLVITSGTRTDAQQEALFRERYVLAGQVNGRRVYDTRRWNGSLWYRISAAGTVAAPGTSNHQEGGPNGPRSIDIRDTGADYGVTRRGTVRDKWMEQHAGDYGFENEGYGFGEPWHKTFRGEIGDGSTVPATAPAAEVIGKLVFSQVVKDRQVFLISRNYDLGPSGADGLAGPKYEAAVKQYQTYLQGRGWYAGKIDGYWGPGTQAGHQKYWDELNAAPKYPVVSVANLGGIGDVRGLQKIAKKFGGYKGKIDNDWGPNSQAGFQTWLGRSGYGSVAKWLRTRWGYKGDDTLGPVMTAALQRANAENFKAL
jgi:D-alanyl-D-alanine carboxypeptidase.